MSESPVPAAIVTPDVLSAAFKNLPYACFILDWAGTIHAFNRRAARVFGNSEDLMGQSFHRLTILSAEAVQQSLRDGLVRGTLAIKMRHGKHLTVPEGTVFRVTMLKTDEPGERLYLLTHDQLRVTAEALGSMNARRIEARRELELLERAHLELRDAFVAMETFTRAASHDLRTPLNTLTGLIELMQKNFAQDLPGDAQDYLAHMAGAADQMTDMTTHLLDHARSLSATIIAEPVQTRIFMQDLIDDLRLQSTEAGAQISLEGHGALVMAEPVLMRVLFSNLLGNALKHPRGDAALTVRVNLGEDTNGRPFIAVQDTGTGFDPGKMKEAFEPFRQLSASGSGMGLGLATCREICTRHAWEIIGETEPGQGSCFTVRL